MLKNIGKALLFVFIAAGAVSASPRFPFPATADEVGQNDRDLNDGIKGVSEDVTALGVAVSTSYIQNRNTLQSGATVYTSSGTIESFTAKSGTFTYSTIGNILNSPAMNSNKFTGLAAGTANGDSVRFEQLATGKILQIVASTATTLTQKTSTSGSYATTGLAHTITPISNSSKMIILTMQNAGASGVAGTICTMRINRNATTVSVPGDFHIFIDDSATESDSGTFMMAVDSPGTTSATQYGTVFARSAGTGTCITNTTLGAVGGNGAYMVIIEIGQ